MRFRVFLTGLVVVFLGFTGCKVVQQSSNEGQNLAYLYNPGTVSLHPRFMVYHNSDSTSNLMVKVYPVELLFNQANKEGAFKAWLGIRYRVFELGYGRTLVDSSALEFPLELKGLKKSFVTNIQIKTKPGNQYMVEVVAMDRLRKTAVQSFIFVDRTSPVNSQNFMVLDHFNRSIIFNPVVDSNRVFNVYFPKKTIDTLYVRYYAEFSKIPYPPNLLIQTPANLGEPDSTWVLPYWDSVGIRVVKRGIYQFLVNEEDKEGCDIYYFGESFPSVKVAEDLIEPLVYLLSDQEMAKIREQPDPKLAADNFWLSAAGDMDRAKELIRIYYNRVLYANYYFTSFREGWQTDRGMIYLIYGPPTSLYKTPEREKWVYGKNSSKNKIIFNFKRVDNFFSQNVYLLQRSQDLNSRWVQAIRAWRQGNVFMVDNE